MKRFISLVAAFVIGAVVAVAAMRMWSMRGGVEGGLLTPGSDTEPAKITFNIPDNSILRFENNEGAAKLMADMDAGRIPTECSVLYDTMGARPVVTVTDQATIVELYNRLALMSVGNPTTWSVTDAYHHIYFTLQDGTKVGWNFETEGILCRGGDNYEAFDRGDLWGLVRDLQDDYMASRN